jgi:predicted adenine nucleotide alpha hydrolase (AANH) superfamily ATPase
MSKIPFSKQPVSTDRIVLHSCCAPCSTALVDYLLQQGITPVIFYYNPNIFPLGEYEIRKSENKRYAEALGLDFVDADYDHEQWKEQTRKEKDEPERGKRCLTCFKLRLSETARFAHENGYSLFATTLATSRWKDLEQINKAGNYAANLYPNITFWSNNWRKNGLAERQAAIIEQYDFYRQQYCGCEYSLRDSNKWRKAHGKQPVEPVKKRKKG